jgi:hypothetical protein
MSTHLFAILLSVLAMVETPNGVPAKPGPAGETGPWQITPAVRRERTADLVRAGLPVTEKTIAREQLIWITWRLFENKIPQTPYNVALAWNGGTTAEIHGTSSKRARDFAQRVANLVEDAQRK